MLVIIGYVIVFAAIFGGFAMAGGHLASMLQPVEVLMIGGGALGAFIVGNSMKSLKATFAALPGCLKGSKYDKKLYMELMALLYDILVKMRKEMHDFRLEVRQLFKKQAESLSRAITDAVKMLADQQMTEAKLQELEDELDDLKKQVKALQKSIHTPS